MRFAQILFVAFMMAHCYVECAPPHNPNTNVFQPQQQPQPNQGHRQGPPTANQNPYPQPPPPPGQQYPPPPGQPHHQPGPPYQPQKQQFGGQQPPRDQQQQQFGGQQPPRDQQQQQFGGQQPPRDQQQQQFGGQQPPRDQQQQQFGGQQPPRDQQQQQFGGQQPHRGQQQPHGQPQPHGPYQPFPQAEEIPPGVDMDLPAIPDAVENGFPAGAQDSSFDMIPPEPAKEQLTPDEESEVIQGIDEMQDGMVKAIVQMVEEDEGRAIEVENAELELGLPPHSVERQMARESSRNPATNVKLFTITAVICAITMLFLGMRGLIG